MKILVAIACVCVISASGLYFMQSYKASNAEAAAIKRAEEISACRAVRDKYPVPSLQAHMRNDCRALGVNF